MCNVFQEKIYEEEYIAKTIISLIELKTGKELYEAHQNMCDVIR